MTRGASRVDEVRVGDGYLITTLVKTAEDYSELPTALVGEVLKLNLFREEDIDLESAFMALTKGTGDDFEKGAEQSPFLVRVCNGIASSSC